MITSPLRIWTLLLAIVVSGCAAPGGEGGAPPASSAPPTLSPMLERVMPAVVSIAVEGRQAVDPVREGRFLGAGSGIIIDADEGHVLTNAHVVLGAENIVVSLADRRNVPAEILGLDSGTDLAVLTIPAEGLTELPLGDSDRLRVGDYVVAIGNPFGLGQTVTLGIVSATGRSGLRGAGGFQDFIQTDASINPGSSGGALVTLTGELVGINNAILSRTGGNLGIAFAIPASLAAPAVRQLVSYGSLSRGELGIVILDVTPAIAAGLGLGVDQGALVIAVRPGSAAARAGLRQGDVVTAVNGRAVRGSADLRNQVGLRRPGTEVDLSVIRAGQGLTMRTVLNEALAP